MAVRLSEGSWDLVSGTLVLATSEPFPLGVHLVMMQGGGHALTTSGNVLRDSAFCWDLCCSRASIEDFYFFIYSFLADMPNHSSVNHLTCFFSCLQFSLLIEEII